MLNHLEKYNETQGEKTIERPDLAFSPEGLDEMNKNIKALNAGKSHHPIFKVRTYETKGNKFAVGTTGNKKDKYVEAAKGTNLFFAIYQDENSKRNFETIPLNIVIERQKQGLISVPEQNDAGHKLVCYLSPNDLVYIPNDDEKENSSLVNLDSLTNVQKQRIYKMVSSTGNQCFFIKHDIAATIVNKVEYSPLNKMEKSIDGLMIKDTCVKLKVSRLGIIARV